MLQTGDQNYLGDLDPKDALDGCKLLLEGRRNIVTTLTDPPGDMDIITSVSVLEASVASCRHAIRFKDVKGLEALLYVDDFQSKVMVYCKTSYSCQLFNVTRGPDSQNGGDRRRQLLANDLGNDVVDISFGKSWRLRCSMDGCVSERGTRNNRIGRRLAAAYNDETNRAPIEQTLEYYFFDPDGTSLEGYFYEKGMKCRWIALGFRFCLQPDDYYGGSVLLIATEEKECRIDPRCCPSEANCRCYPGENIIYEKIFDVDGRFERFGNQCSPLVSSTTAPDTETKDTSNCFPASTLVYLEDGSARKMSEIVIGDCILTVEASGEISLSPVYVIPHAQHTGIFRFKRIVTASNHSVMMSTDHYMLVADPERPGQWPYRRAVEAERLKAGDRVWILSDNEKKISATWILSVSDVHEKGIFAPFILSGTIAADDVIASVCNTMLGSESDMHAFCAWGRLLWASFPQLIKYLHAIGWASPLSIGIGHVARMVLRTASAFLLPHMSLLG